MTEVEKQGRLRSGFSELMCVREPSEDAWCVLMLGEARRRKMEGTTEASILEQYQRSPSSVYSFEMEGLDAYL